VEPRARRCGALWGLCPTRTWDRTTEEEFVAALTGGA